MRLDADDEAATLIGGDMPAESRPSDVDSKTTTLAGEENERPISRDEEDRRIAQGADES